MNMINLDMYTMRQMRNYRLRIKFKKFSQSGVCGITVRTTLFDATEVYTYTEEDLEKYGASELIRQSVSKFIETYELNFMIAIYNNKEETTMRNEKDIMEELTSENNSLKKTVKMLKDAINKRDEELRNLIKKNESLAEDIDMYWHHLVETIDKNEKLKDDIQTRMNNEKLDAVRIADLEDTVQMLREIIRRKDAAIQHDADAFRKEIDRLKSDCDALNKENIRLCKKRLDKVYDANYIMRDDGNES